MNNIIWLMRNILKVLFKKKLNLLLTIGLPVMGVFLSFLLYGHSDQQTVRVGIVNHDHKSMTADTIKFIKGLNHVKVKEIKASEVNDKVSSRELDCVITFPANFSKSMRNGHPETLQIASIKGAAVTALVKSYLNNYIGNIASLGKVAKGDAAAFQKLYSNYQQSTFKVHAKALSDTSKNKDMTYQTIGFLVMFMLLAAINLSAMMTKEKERRTYFRILSAPIDGKTYVLANVMSNFIIMIAQILITLFFMKVVFHFQVNIPFWEFFVTLLVFGLVSIGLSLAIVAFAKNSGMANAMQSLIVFPTCLLAGCFFPVEIMPNALKKIADFMPQHWLLDTIDKLQHGEPMYGLYLNFLILFAFAVCFFLLAAFKIGRQNSVQNFV
ncbi:ABC transporter permease [Camelliibacillus cellulosilyticus]|uniref:ABC transporter permease n=1 Tax=Camelliibacillus cellulosilyticus TaxID=2174486 RepID=A0ABV9GTI2_9BACL